MHRNYENEDSIDVIDQQNLSLKWSLGNVFGSYMYTVINVWLDFDQTNMYDMKYKYKYMLSSAKQ